MIVSQAFRTQLRRPTLQVVAAIRDVVPLSSSSWIESTRARAFSTQGKDPEPPRLRRKRTFKSRYFDEATSTPLVNDGGLSAPFAPLEDNMDEYLKKTSLSPWVPVPDAVARRMLDLAHANPDDIHVDLGSGDGRVNFAAIDPPFNVRKSIGIDIDTKVMEIAEERLSKRHPKPNVEFKVADLIGMNKKIWDEIAEATVITMYFVAEALELIRPHLERALKGRQCRIVTVGYIMPGWEPQWVETILGLSIHVYEWGRLSDSVVNTSKDNDDFVPERPRYDEAEDMQLTRRVRHFERYVVPFLNDRDDKPDDESWDKVSDEKEEEEEYQWKKP